jgi:DNA-binding Lrp family transcriptional regulator
MDPVKAASFGHGGYVGNNRGPEDYLDDMLDLNIVYSCYFTPRTAEEIADELGVTPAFLAERIAKLEGNGFLVREKGDRFTTYVEFSPLTYSVERMDKLRGKQLEAAAVLADEFRPVVRDAVGKLGEVYLPTENRELLERTILLHKLTGTCIKGADRDLSRYTIKTTAGGDFRAYVELESTRTDPDYEPKNMRKNYWCCGTMNRWSEKYPVSSWSYDTRFTTRKGDWENNLTSDYEALYEYMTGQLPDTPANTEKRARLRERGFIDAAGKVCVMVAHNEVKDAIERIPPVSEDILRRFADAALEYAMTKARDYPPQMQDLIVCENVRSFIGPAVALMTCDLLYERGVWKPLTEAERVAVDLMVFSDTLPAPIG